ncbi:hypothetical protein A3715_17805 [Oleiphilus sp. HI0009]|nr:hypothetical protein A3715_17805 [Oleiphilus sp. HI0009]
MSLSDWLSVIDEAASLNAASIQFIGGEPLLYSGLPDLLDYASALNFESIEVFSNLTFLPPKVISSLISAKAQVAFSIYGSTPRVHDARTTIPGSLDKLVKSLHTLNKHSIPMRAGVILDKKNSDYINDIYDLLDSLDIENRSVDYVRSVGRANTAKNSDASLCGACGFQRLSVSNDGQISPCIFSFETPIGNFKDISLLDALSSDELTKFRRQFSSSNGVMEAFCEPYLCGPDHRCVPDLRGPSCSPDYCQPGINKIIPTKTLD